jgi:hypothetical protein
MSGVGRALDQARANHERCPEMRRTLFAVLVVVVVVATACGANTKAKPAQMPANGNVSWPAPADPLVRARAAGLVPERRESLAYHVHAHLDVFLNGRHVVVPAGIGINVKDSGVQVFSDTPDGSKAYGGIELCATACISPLHTHDTTGILHTESATVVANRLGQFFAEWGVRLTRDCVGAYCHPTNVEVYVNGDRYTDDPAGITLTKGKEIAIVIGTPPSETPKTGDFSGA